MSDTNFNTCWGCKYDQPNQLAHMEYGGCLYSPDDDEFGVYKPPDDVDDNKDAPDAVDVAHDVAEEVAPDAPVIAEEVVPDKKPKLSSMSAVKGGRVRTKPDKFSFK